MALDLAAPRPVPVCMPRWTAAREDTRPEPMNFRWSASLYAYGSAKRLERSRLQ
jgi:hypothetical protein